MLLNLLAGVGLSVYLTQVHLVVHYGSGAAGGLCDLSERVNCNVAAASDFAQIGGIPNAVIGLAFYLAALVPLILAWKRRDPWAAPLLVLGFSLASVYSLFLAGILGLVLRTFCPGCAGLYLVNLLGLVLARVIAGRGYRACLSRFFTDLKGLGGSSAVFAFLLTFLLALGGGWWGSQLWAGAIKADPAQKSASAQKWLKEEFLATAPVSQADWAELKEGPAKGAQEPVITVVEFSDFECPFCARAVPLLKQLEQEYPDKVQVVFRHLPLKMHPHAEKAALAGVCAERQGSFWPMHDTLFAHQRALKVEDLVGYAGELKLDQEAFRACLEDPTARKEMLEDIDLGRRMKLRGTPMIYINGRLVRGAVPWEKFKLAVEHELGQQSPR